MLENCFQYELPEAGCDEAGRGCLAGPVFAAAVMLPPDFHDPLLNDSKQMTERNREKLRAVIEREAVAWAVEAVSAERIDEINILNASFEGMSLAAARLDPAPGYQAIDVGHVDVEYEWWRMGAHKKVKLERKYVNETAIGSEVADAGEEYRKQIIAQIV